MIQNNQTSIDYGKQYTLVPLDIIQWKGID